MCITQIKTILTENEKKHYYLFTKARGKLLISVENDLITAIQKSINKFGPYC